MIYLHITTYVGFSVIWWSCKTWWWRKGGLLFFKTFITMRGTKLDYLMIYAGLGKAHNDEELQKALALPGKKTVEFLNTRAHINNK